MNNQGRYERPELVWAIMAPDFPGNRLDIGLRLLKDVVADLRQLKFFGPFVLLVAPEELAKAQAGVRKLYQDELPIGVLTSIVRVYANRGCKRGQAVLFQDTPDCVKFHKDGRVQVRCDVHGNCGIATRGF